MAVDQKKFMQGVYDAIYDSLTTVPSGIGDGRPVEDKNKSYLSLALQGNPIDATQFQNEWTPDNPQGSTFASESFASLVDFVPVMSPAYASSGNSVDQLYGEVVNANVSPPAVDPAAQAAYNRAFDLLYVDGNDFNDQGQQVTVKVESPLYRNYKNKKSLYNAKLTAYQLNFLNYDLSKPADQRKWSILAPTLRAEVDIAYGDFQAARPGVVETALATLGQYEASSLASIFTRARQIYEQTKKGSGIGNPDWHHCEAYPGNWFADSAAPNFTGLTISSASFRLNESSRFTSWSAGGSVGFGLWSVGASASSTSQSYSLSTESSNISISFLMGRIEIRRRWLNPSLFSLRGWSVAGRGAGGYSNGQSTANSGVFPLLTTAFIVARDIKISGTWGSSDLQLASQSTSASASVGWGPFSLSGSYRSGSSSRRFSSTFDGTTITVPGVQIIGWISAIQPFSPPSGGPSGQPLQPSGLAGGELKPRRNPFHPLATSGAGDSVGYYDFPAAAPEASPAAELPAAPTPSLPNSIWTSAEN